MYHQYLSLDAAKLLQYNVSFTWIWHQLCVHDENVIHYSFDNQMKHRMLMQILNSMRWKEINRIKGNATCDSKGY